MKTTVEEENKLLNEKIAELRNLLSPLMNYFQIKKEINKKCKNSEYDDNYVKLFEILEKERQNIVDNNIIKRINKALEN